MSNFSFSNSVFKRLVSQWRQKVSLCGHGLTPLNSFRSYRGGRLRTVFPGFLTPVQTQISFQRHRLLFSHASAKVRGENTPERKFTSTRYRTHNHQVRSPTHPQLSTKLSGWGPVKRNTVFLNSFPNKAWFLRV